MQTKYFIQLNTDNTEISIDIHNYYDCHLSCFEMFSWAGKILIYNFFNLKIYCTSTVPLYISICQQCAVKTSSDKQYLHSVKSRWVVANNVSSEVFDIIKLGRRVILNRSEAVNFHKLLTIRYLLRGRHYTQDKGNAKNKTIIETRQANWFQKIFHTAATSRLRVS